MMQRRSAAGGNAADADADPGVESDGVRSSDEFADGNPDPSAVAEHALALVPVRGSRSHPPVEVPRVWSDRAQTELMLQQLRPSSLPELGEEVFTRQSSRGQFTSQGSPKF